MKRLLHNFLHPFDKPGYKESLAAAIEADIDKDRLAAAQAKDVIMRHEYNLFIAKAAIEAKSTWVKENL
jgi:hypothetical protein